MPDDFVIVFYFHDVEDQVGSLEEAGAEEGALEVVVGLDGAVSWVPLCVVKASKKATNFPTCHSRIFLLL